MTRPIPYPSFPTTSQHIGVSATQMKRDEADQLEADMAKAPPGVARCRGIGWDPTEGRLLIGDGDEVRRLRSRLIGLHDLAAGFIVLLEEWGQQLDAVAGEVDEYIESND